MTKKIDDQTRFDILSDWNRGWSRKSIATALNVSEKNVRTVVYKQPDYMIKQIDHASAQKYRRQRIREIADTYNRQHGIPKAKALKLARSNSLEGLRLLHNPEREARFESEYGFDGSRARRSEVGSEDYEESLLARRLEDQGLNRLAF